MFQKFIIEFAWLFAMQLFYLFLCMPVAIATFAYVCSKIFKRLPSIATFFNSFAIALGLEDIEDDDVIDDDNTQIKKDRVISDMERKFFNWDRQDNIEYHDNDTDWDSSIDEFDLDLYGDNVVIDAKDELEWGDDDVTDVSDPFLQHKQYCLDSQYDSNL